MDIQYFLKTCLQPSPVTDMLRYGDCWKQFTQWVGNTHCLSDCGLILFLLAFSCLFRRANKLHLQIDVDTSNSKKCCKGKFHRYQKRQSYYLQEANTYIGNNMMQIFMQKLEKNIRP